MSNPARAAADTGLPEVTRRSVLAGVSLLGVVAAPALARGEPEEPVLPHYRDWVRARADWWDAVEGLADAKGAEDRGFAAFERMADMTPTSAAGIAALAQALWVYIGPVSIPSSPDFAEEATPMDNRVIAPIWRGATGQGGFPDQANGGRGKLSMSPKLTAH